MFLISDEILYSNSARGHFRVGFTEKHGMAVELSKYPPSGVEYSFIEPVPSSNKFIRSPIKGYLNQYKNSEYDLIEAILSPILTKTRWIYYLENIQAATTFSLLGFPLPRQIRVAYLKSLFLKDNFKKLLFWSKAGKETLHTYGKIKSETILKKTAVVYPAVRDVPDYSIRFTNDQNLNILFSGDFFRKGGVNVIDAFERAQRIYPKINLLLCCDEKMDFNTTDTSLRAEYLRKIHCNKGIRRYGRVPRDRIIDTILPSTDIYLLPTYAEAFGYAILEAMAFGIPIISTNLFAIPEMVEHNKSGFLIDIGMYNCDKLFKGYVINKIPRDFREHVTNHLFDYLCKLIESPDLRESFGRVGLSIARTKFSFRERNMKMSQIYHEVLARN